MYVSTSEIVQKANSIVAQCGTRDPLRIARDLGIEVMYCPFNEQRGAYKVLMRNRFIFVKNDLHPVMENIVLLHELGHDALHREEATKVGGFKEFEILDHLASPLSLAGFFSCACISFAFSKPFCAHSGSFFSSMTPRKSVR